MHKLPRPLPEKPVGVCVRLRLALLPLARAAPPSRPMIPHRPNQPAPPRRRGVDRGRVRCASGGERGAECTASGGESGDVRVLGPGFSPDLRPRAPPLAPLVHSQEPLRWTGRLGDWPRVGPAPRAGRGGDGVRGRACGRPGTPGAPEAWPPPRTPFPSRPLRRGRDRKEPQTKIQKGAAGIATGSFPTTRARPRCGGRGGLTGARAAPQAPDPTITSPPAACWRWRVTRRARPGTASGCPRRG